MKKSFRKYIIIMTVIVVMLNLAAWLSVDFCDWYIDNVFYIWTSTYGRLTGLFPFSVGEIMLVAALFAVIVAAILPVLLIFLRKRKGYKCFVRKYYKICFVILLNVCLILTLNCTLLYHCTRIDPNPDYEKRTYTVEELGELYTYIVEQCNYYGDMFDRDERGYIIYEEDIMQEAKDSMLYLSDEYKRLAGYYPSVKKLMNSNLMCQSHLAGYYFPFSMEATVNSKMYVVNNPATYCHELAHLHGYIYEDEANFLGYLACIRSENIFFRYSGYMSVYTYVRNAYLDSLDRLTPEEKNLMLEELPKLKHKDYIFLLPETRKEVEAHAVINTGVVDDISDKFTDASLKLNGVKEGIAAYDGVVDLLLQYYDGKLY